MSELEQLRSQLVIYETEKRTLEARVEALSDFVENASVPLHWVNANGDIIWANKAELDALGYTHEEYIGASIRNFHADADVIEQILQRLTNYETLIDVPARLICKNGTVKHVLISSSAWRKDGEFVHTRCFTRDVTHLVEEEKKRSELLKQLAESETRFRLATASTNVGTWDWQPLSGELYWSEECRELLGVASNIAIPFELFLSFVHSEDQENVKRKITSLLEGDGDDTLNIRYRIYKQDTGELKWIKAQCKLDSAITDGPKRLVGTLLDVTEAKYGEDRSAMLSSIIDSSDDAIVSKTLEGIITSWNDSAERTFGYNAEEMIGQPIFKLIPEDRKDEEILILSRLRRGERVEHFETKRQTKTGELLDISLTISPVKDAQGNIIGLSKIARDITAKKQEEQRKNAFVAIVSHELKTPLTSITIYNQMLTERAESNKDDFSLNALKRMEIQIKKMTSMIRDFLSLARIEESKLPLNKEAFDLQELVKEIADDPQFTTLKHTIHVSGSSTVQLFADRDKMAQVMVNLLGNAIKYSPNGGHITCGYEVLDNQVKIFVKDEGQGIETMDQKRLFERFYRASGNNKNNVSGFGIGLYLVSEILRSHQSQIYVASEPGHGAEFYFSMDIYNKTL